MIGDYVLVSGTPRKVEMITKKKIGYHINPQENRLYYASLRDVEPIKTTEELLKANGFRYGEPYWTHVSDYKGEFASNIVRVGLWSEIGRGVLIKSERDAEGYVKSVHSPYSPHLHTLQQACRFCGIEIDWKL